MWYIFLLWLVFTVVYFRKEILTFLNGNSKKDTTHIKIHSNDIKDTNIFGSTKQLQINSHEQNNIISETINEDSNVTKANEQNQPTEEQEEEREDEVEEENEDIVEEVEEISGDMVELEFPDSDDQSSEDMAIESAKSFEELTQALTVVVKTINNDAAGEDEKMQAGQILTEIEGTDLFAQLHKQSGNDRVKSLLGEFEKIWDSDYERQPNNTQANNEDKDDVYSEAAKSFNIEEFM